MHTLCLFTWEGSGWVVCMHMMWSCGAKLWVPLQDAENLQPSQSDEKITHMVSRSSIRPNFGTLSRKPWDATRSKQEVIHHSRHFKWNSLVPLFLKGCSHQRVYWCYRWNIKKEKIIIIVIIKCSAICKGVVKFCHLFIQRQSREP